MKFSTQPRHQRTSDFWTPLRAALTLTALALLATFGLSGCNSMPADKPGTPKATITVNSNSGPRADTTKSNNPPPMPATLPASALDASLETIDGKAFKLADLKGKVLVVDLWATWCGPCRASIPELVSLQKEFGPRGLEVIGLDIDPDTDTSEDVKAFADKYDINYKLAFADNELARSLMSGGNIPQSIVVGRDGRITEHFIGFNPARTPEKLREAIEKAISAKP
jgi:cytochrome c biogenesis protein CcmG/thiol:disulfide interchange protein DsbE